MLIRGRGGVGVVAGLAVTLALAPAASAAGTPTWQPGTGVGTGTTGEEPLVGNLRGDLAFSTRRAAASGVGGGITVQHRLAGATWDASLTTAAPSGDDLGTPAVAVRSDGTAVAVYGLLRGGSATRDLVLAEHAPDGYGWSTRARLGAATGDAVLAADGREGLAVAWPTATGWVTIGDTATTSFTAPSATPAGITGTPRLALDDTGTTTLAWRTAAGGVRVATRRAGATRWDAATDLASSGAVGLRLEVAPSGAAVLAWQEPVTGGLAGRVAVRDAAGRWSAVATLPTGRDDASGLRVAVDGAGTATAVWVDGPQGAGRVRAARGTAAGGFASPETLLTAPGAIGVAADANPAGDVVVLATPAGDGPLAVRRPAGSGWTAAVRLPRTSGSLPVRPLAPSGVVVDEQGNAGVHYESESGSEDQHVVQGLDAAGPRLDDQRAHSATYIAAGVDGEFSARPVDVWAGVFATHWDFGDGSLGVFGQKVAHTWGTVGQRTITVTASDVLGFQTRVTRDLFVIRPSGPGVDGLRVDPPVLDPVRGATLRADVGLPSSNGVLTLRRLEGAVLKPVSTLRIDLPLGNLALPLRGDLAQQLGPGTYVLSYAADPRFEIRVIEPAATLFVVR